MQKSIIKFIVAAASTHLALAFSVVSLFKKVVENTGDLKGAVLLAVITSLSQWAVMAWNTRLYQSEDKKKISKFLMTQMLTWTTMGIVVSTVFFLLTRGNAARIILPIYILNGFICRGSCLKFLTE